MSWSKAGANPFTKVLPGYTAARPTYPETALAALLQHHPQQVVELGAGSGSLTRLLLKHGVHVAAVEASEPMCKQLRQDTPDEFFTTGALSVHCTDAHHTGLPEKSADLVVAAQTWHWLDHQSACAEADRLLRPKGRLAILYNQLDVSVPWVYRLTRIMRSGDVRRGDPPPLAAPFTTPTRTQIKWNRTVHSEDVIALGRTHASYLNASENYRAKMQKNLLWYVYQHMGHSAGATITLPYLTDVWVTSR
ncbi:class I SAM-dependent methyltransferase [Winkia sp. UMB1185]|uniref:class I SAM-dependent methyltransferase n=1 Tax=Winkia sp. UMB1185 TaxID=3046324 RepID=UPI0006608C67|nr:class I SAM-dependent methyltransferase [Winkia sp. UMB1185]MDK7228805.1 class I SAM-dependent methyltransferase [Winkia sp. UMB1185]